MECKVVSDFGQFVFDSVLIETLWNVKTYTQSDKDIKAFVLIETLWNVKIKQEMQPCSGVSY